MSSASPPAPPRCSRCRTPRATPPATPADEPPKLETQPSPDAADPSADNPADKDPPAADPTEDNKPTDDAAADSGFDATNIGILYENDLPFSGSVAVNGAVNGAASDPGKSGASALRTTSVHY